MVDHWSPPNCRQPWWLPSGRVAISSSADVPVFTSSSGPVAGFSAAAVWGNPVADQTDLYDNKTACNSGEDVDELPDTVGSCHSQGATEHEADSSDETVCTSQ